MTKPPETSVEFVAQLVRERDEAVALLIEARTRMTVIVGETLGQSQRNLELMNAWRDRVSSVIGE